MAKNKKIILGFVGLPCAGKGTVIEYLVEKYGFFYTSTSDEIREVIRKRGQKITRDSLQRVAGQQRQKHGPDIWAKKAWEKVKASKSSRAVVDSLRAIEEIEFLKKQPGFYLAAVSAKLKIRFQRMKERNREGDPQTWSEFVKMEERDRHAEGRSIDACLKMADFEIENNGNVEELHQAVNQIVGVVIP